MSLELSALTKYNNIVIDYSFFLLNSDRNNVDELLKLASMRAKDTKDGISFFSNFIYNSPHDDFSFSIENIASSQIKEIVHKNISELLPYICFNIPDDDEEESDEFDVDKLIWDTFSLASKLSEQGSTLVILADDEIALKIIKQRANFDYYNLNIGQIVSKTLYPSMSTKKKIRKHYSTIAAHSPIPLQLRFENGSSINKSELISSGYQARLFSIQNEPNSLFLQFRETWDCEDYPTHKLIYERFGSPMESLVKNMNLIREASIIHEVEVLFDKEIVYWDNDCRLPGGYIIKALDDNLSHLESYELSKNDKTKDNKQNKHNKKAGDRFDDEYDNIITPRTFKVDGLVSRIEKNNEANSNFSIFGFLKNLILFILLVLVILFALSDLKVINISDYLPKIDFPNFSFLNEKQDDRLGKKQNDKLEEKYITRPFKTEYITEFLFAKLSNYALKAKTADGYYMSENGRLEGYVEYYYNDGSIYKGEYMNGLREGRGYYLYKDGHEYLGYFHNNKFSGKGILSYNNGNYYIGNFEEGLPQGYGEFTWNSPEYKGQKYTGNYFKGKRNGQGVYSYPNGMKYTGDFKDDLKHGKGEIVYTNGVIYKGDFKDDEATGTGELIATNGDRFIGEVSGGYPVKGKLITKDGVSYDVENGEIIEK